MRPTPTACKSAASVPLPPVTPRLPAASRGARAPPARTCAWRRSASRFCRRSAMWTTPSTVDASTMLPGYACHVVDGTGEVNVPSTWRCAQPPRAATSAWAIAGRRAARAWWLRGPRSSRYARRIHPRDVLLEVGSARPRNTGTKVLFGPEPRSSQTSHQHFSARTLVRDSRTPVTRLRYS